MVIQDDGIGINLENNVVEKSSGIGLLNMKSIVRSFDGTLEIEGIPGIGTEIQIEIPHINMLTKQEVVGI